MDELEDEAKCLVEDLAQKLNFRDANAMIMYAESMKEMHLEDRCEECMEKFGGKIADQVENEANELMAENTSFTGVSTEKPINRGRKSRKSVCVPKLAYSSSESENEDNGDEGSEDEIDESVFLDCQSRENSASEEFVDTNEDRLSMDFVVNKRDKGTDVISRVKGLKIDETENVPKKVASPLVNRLKETQNEDSDCSPVIARKKPSRRIASESDDDSENEKSVHKISSDDENQKFVRKIKTRYNSVSSGTNSADASPDVRYKSRRVKMLSDESETNSQSETADESDDSRNKSGDDSDSDLNDSITNITRSIKKMNVVHDISSDSDDSDFERKTKRSNLATPKPSKKQKKRFPLLEEETNVAVVKTPKSSIRNILNSLPTPSAVPGTPAYKRQFNGKREVIVKDLFKLYNETVFDDKLPAEFEITWNKRLTKTAGFCYLLRKGEERRSRIELSDKVIDSVERIRDTLIHEMCHAATWIFEGKRGHGYEWKRWANKANKIHPDLPVVTTCHSYEITTKYNFQCDGCRHVFGRHSKSIDPTKHRCGNCGGVPLLIGGNSTSSESKTPKLNAYATYVKENFSTVKGANPGLSTKDIMKKIAEGYRTNKKETGNNKENVLCDT